MSVTTAQPTKKTTAKGMKTWDSPWLNAKFLVGLGMVLFMGSMALWGPIVWDTTLARVASSPLNLPPPWAPGYRLEEQDAAVETEETVEKAEAH